MKIQYLSTFLIVTSIGVNGANIERRQNPPATPASSPNGAGLVIPPLAAIVSGAPAEPTMALPTTYKAGDKPSNIPSAPGLPAPFVYNAAEWPQPDALPPTDSPQVKEWMKELDGANIPVLKPTLAKDGTCDQDPQAAAEAASRGWWTCGGYLRSTDISICPTKSDWGVSFDDGPAPHTPKLLAYLKQKSLLATFFVVGSRVLSLPDVLTEEYMAGHEISIHTWSHQRLTTLTNEQIVAELGWTREVIRKVLGVTPTSMRPPYGDIDDRVRGVLKAMKLTPIMWTKAEFDTNDWRLSAGIETGAQSLKNFETIIANGAKLDTGFIVLQHDLYQQPVDLAVGYSINSALAFTPKLNLRAIGTCLGWPAGNMYLETTSGAKSAAPAPALAPNAASASEGGVSGVNKSVSSPAAVPPSSASSTPSVASSTPSSTPSAGSSNVGPAGNNALSSLPVLSQIIFAGIAAVGTLTLA